MLARLLVGVTCILAGGAAIRYRAALARQARRNQETELRYGSLLNADRVEGERAAWSTPGAQRSLMWEATLIGALLVLAGLVLIAASVG